MKIHPVTAELFHADGRTDMTKLIVSFRSFANAPGKCLIFRVEFEVKHCLIIIYRDRTEFKARVSISEKAFRESDFTSHVRRAFLIMYTSVVPMGVGKEYKKMAADFRCNNSNFFGISTCNRIPSNRGLHSPYLSFHFAVRRRVPTTIFYSLSYPGPVFSPLVTFFLSCMQFFPHILPI
jgi:hypothetical protein